MSLVQDRRIKPPGFSDLIIDSRYLLAVTTRQQRAAASSSRSSVGGECKLAEACGMQLVMWPGVCMGCWWSGLGSDEGGPGIKQGHG
eukprot:293684-Pelagomonas_calceolata.AAC.1